MQLNKIFGSINLKSVHYNYISVEKTICMLHKFKFITEHNFNEITLKRSIQFTMDTGKNKLKVFLFSYCGEINICKNQNNIIDEYSLNINAQSFKLTLFMILLYLIFYIISIKIHLLLYVLILTLLVLFQRVLIKNHFINIIKKKL